MRPAALAFSAEKCPASIHCLTWAAFTFRLATPTSKNSARSISGNSTCRPDFGGHSIVIVLLTIFPSQSPANAHAASDHRALARQRVVARGEEIPSEWTDGTMPFTG